ncbi:MAG: DNA-binding protein [Candidatus Kapaibacterium sp.]
MEELSEIRQSILGFLKRERSVTIASIADHITVSYEAIRQQVVQMEREGWIVGRLARGKGNVGRPITRYSLTTAGDHLFPKHYDLLAIRLIEMIGERMGEAVLKDLLASITDAQVAGWRGKLEGKSLSERLEILRGLYLEGDAYMDVEAIDGEYRLVERNCPFLNVATRHPALCSTTVSTLSRLLGFRVLREERFQAGDGRCVFRVLTDQPIDSAGAVFQIELPVDVPATLEGAGQAK